MTSSDQIDQLGAALAAAQGEMEGATKDRDNPFFRSKYADLASVWDACRAPLSKHGLAVVQFPRVTFTGTPEVYEWVAKSGETRRGVSVIAIVSVVTRVVHASGQYVEDEMSTMLPTGDPQSIGSATTYLRRYALQSAVGIAPEDDDAEAAHSGGSGNRPATASAASSGPRAMAKAAAAPKGYAEWLDGLRSVADEGTEALVAAWNKAPVELRRHLTTTQPAVWESLKGTAVHASAKSKPVSA